MANVPPKLGPFEPLHRLGAGGMAETFVAVRRGPAGFEQRVCIKRILPAYEDDQDFVASFLDEARTSAALRHANIVQVVDFGQNESDGSHYLALELVDGMDLRALMQRQGVLDAELVTLIAAELAAALAHAHADDEGRPAVVHRDLSPSNVLISRAGEVKLTDFGIARVVGGAHRTASGVIKGKVPYMPPEYIDGGRFDARGDLFSLGVMLYELCHGRRPFDGDSELDTMRRIASGERRAFEVPAPPALIATVERLLQRVPEARFESALAMLDALPPISVHRTRKRLSELVRGRPSLPPAESLALAAGPGATVALLPTAPASTTSLPTRTRTGTASSAPSRAALYALGAALALMLLVIAAALVRNQQQARAVAVPALPGSLAEPVVVAEAEAPAPASAEPPVRAPAEEPAGTEPPVPSAAHMVPLNEPTSATGSSHHASRQPAELRVVVIPFGDVWVDDKYAGQSPLSLRLAPGTHEIAIGEGRAREHRTVRLKAGESESLTFRRPSPTHE